jgi:hypothetical protein
MLRHADSWKITDVSKNCSAFIFRLPINENTTAVRSGCQYLPAETRELFSTEDEGMIFRNVGNYLPGGMV